jgi:pyridoxamine 5'-phosphate oxidase
MPTRSLPPPPPFYNDLAMSLDYAWSLLESGGRDRVTGFHSLSVGSIEITPAGPVPRQRTMILREANREKRTLRFHSDQRSPKFSQISRTPQICITHYDASQKIEIRAQARGDFHLGDVIAAKAWTEMRDVSRFCYRSPKAPGEIVDSVDEYQSPSSTAVDVNDAVARRNFCVLIASIHEMEWIYLDSRGNRRARYRWVDDRLDAQWIQH